MRLIRDAYIASILALDKLQASARPGVKSPANLGSMTRAVWFDIRLVARLDQDRSNPHHGFDRSCESGLHL